jgi:OOP family OmpA-OmpF porin
MPAASAHQPLDLDDWKQDGEHDHQHPRGVMTMTTGVGIQTVALTCAAALWAGSALAAGSDGSGLYLGVGAGLSHGKIDDGRVNQQLRDAGFSSATTTHSENSAAYKAFVGYSFNSYIAVEGGYFYLGKFKFDSTVAGPGTLHQEIKSSGFNIDAVLSYPLAQGFSVFARAGVQNAKSKANYSATGSVHLNETDDSETKTSWKGGLGVGYEFSQRIGVRGEWERYRIADGTEHDHKFNVDVFGLSVYYKF